MGLLSFVDFKTAHSSHNTLPPIKAYPVEWVAEVLFLYMRMLWARLPFAFELCMPAI